MAGQPQYYDSLIASIDGLILVELENVEVTLEDQVQDVQTMGKEYGGITPGPQKTVVRFGSFVPAAGEEFNVSHAARIRSFHKVTLVRGDGKKWVSDGSFRGLNYSAAVGQNAKSGFEFHGSPGEWE